jgi:betaine-aldehyde dehydrogenase
MTLDQSPRTYTNLIDGAWTAATEKTTTRRNPANGEVVGTYASSTAADADRAVAGARAAFDSGIWSHKPPIERGRILLRWADLIRENAETLAQIEASEVGKPIRLARGDIQGIIELTEYCGTLAFEIHGDAFDRVNGEDLAMVLREPVGVVAAIVPWNFPGLIYSQKVPFALAAGCTVVVKPAEFTPGTALELSRLAVEAGVPANVINVVTGAGSIVGQRLAEHRDVDLLSFTGSTAVAKTIAMAASGTHKHLAFELGGKGATIVFDDADLDEAVDGVLFGVFYNQGETCIAGTRLLVQDTIADEFVARVGQRAAQLKIGDVYDSETDIGAMISEDHLDKVLGYVESGRQSGATLVTGGERVTVAGAENGLFVAPTVFDHVAPDAQIFQEEIFGPVLTTTRFSTDQEAIDLANRTVYGLAHGVWTKNIDRAIRLGRALRAGTVWVNTANDGAPQLPFGGYRESGNSREKGRAGLDEYLVSKTFHIHVGARTLAYPANGRP